MKILITGTAGFIGMHTALKLANSDKSNRIVGLDNINDYYDVNLKYDRLKEQGFENREDIDKGSLLQSTKFTNLSFVKQTLEDKEKLLKLFDQEKFDYVIHLAAQASVRYDNYQSFIDRNIVGTFNILEASRINNIKHLVYASSSSVYGANAKIPFSEDDKVDAPVSLYAATKKSTELLAHSYSYMFKLPTTGLRFFTVYGPFGRPDMSPNIFANGITKGEEIKVFNNGDMKRDFTYIDDIVEGITRILVKPTEKEIPYDIFNIGNGAPVDLMTYIKTIEKEIGREAIIKLMPRQPEEVQTTFADTSKLQKEVGYKPKVSIEEGIREFVEWHKNYYKV